MAGQNKLKFEVDFEVNKANMMDIKKALKDLQTQVEGVSKRQGGGIDESLKEAGKAAKELDSIINKSWNWKLGKLDLSKVNNEIKSAYGSVEKMKASFEGAGRTGVNTYNTFSRAVLNTNLQLKESNKLLDSMATTMTNTVKWGVTSRIFNTVTESIQKAWSYSVSLDKSLNDIRIVTNKSADDMERFAIQANKAAKALGSSTRNYTEASLIYYQQGLGDAQAAQRTEATIKAANVTGQTAQEVSEQLTAVWNGYKVNAKEVELYVDKLAAVAASTASDLEELSTGMSKVASAANIMGVDIDQLNAQMSTIISVTRQAPESVGTALKTIYARMGDIKAGLDEETSLGKYTSKMAELGVNVLDANGNLRDMGDVIEEVGGKWESLTREQQIALSQIMAGTRQYNNLLALFDNWGDYTKALNTSKNAAGELQKQQDIYMESTSAHLKQLSTEAERTYKTLFNAKEVNAFTDALTGTLSVFNKFLESLGGGANTFVWFGSLATKIFNKQIAGGIQESIQKVRDFKENKAALDLMRETINAGLSTKEGAEPPLYQTEDLDRAEKILNIQKNITESEFNELNLLRQKVAEEQAVVDYYEMSKRDELKITKEKAEADKKEIINDKAKIANYKVIEGHIQKINALKRKDRTSKDDDVKSLREQLNILEKYYFKEEQINSIRELRGKITKGETITKEDEIKLLNIQKEILEKINLEEKDRDAILKSVLLTEEEYVKLSNEYSKNKATLEDAAKAGEEKGNIANMVTAISTFVQVGSAAVGIIKTITNPDLTELEKIEQIFSNLSGLALTLLINFDSLKDGTNALAIAMGAKGVTSATSFAGSLAGVISVALPYAIAIGAVIGATYLLVKAYNADADAAKKAAENAAELTERYEELKNKAEELKNTVSDYKNELDSLSKLKQGTEEYNEALEKANATAKELMESYNLYDKAEYKNGLLTFKKGALENLQGRINANTQKSAERMYAAKIQANEAAIKSGITDTSRSTSTRLNSIAILGGIISPLALLNSEIKITNNQVADIISSLQKLKEEDEIQYEQVKNSNIAMEEWIKKTYKSNNNIQMLSKQISENRNAFIDLTESVIQSTEANKRYYDEINKIAIEEKYGNQIAYMSTNAKTGTIDQGLYQQILDIINNSKIQQEITKKELEAEEKRNTYTLDFNRKSITSQEAWDNDFWHKIFTSFGAAQYDNSIKSNLNEVLTDTLKDLGISDEQLTKRLGRSNIETNKDLAEAYAKLMGIDISRATWNGKKYTNDTGETILDASSQSARAKIRSQIVSDLLRELENSKIQAEAESKTQDFINSLNQARINATISGKEYGTDFSQVLTNAISSKTKEFDFSNIFNRLDPDEIKKLQSLDIEGVKNLFGFEDGAIEQFGFESAEKLYNSLQEGLKKYSWDINKAITASMELKSSEIEEYGSDLSKKKFAEYKEDIEVYAKNLMEIAESEKSVGDGLKYDSDTAVEFAFRVIKMNKAIDTLADNMEDWTDIINKSSKTSQEYAEAMYNLKDALADVYDTEMDYISHSFIKNHLEEIQKIATGDEKAIEGLRDSLSEEIVTNIIVKNEQNGLFDIDENAILDKFKDLREKIQTSMEGIAIGDIIPPKIDDTDLVNGLNQIIEDSQMTVEQANAMFSALGIEPTYETDTVVQKQKMTPTQTVHKVIAASTKTFEDGTQVPEYTAIDEVTTLPPVETDIEVPITALAVNGKQPKISGVKKAPTGSFNNYSSINSGGKSPGKSSNKSGGGGSSKQPKKTDRLEKEINRYHDVDIQLKNIQTDLDKINTQKNKLFGKDLISNLNRQLELLNKQIETTGTKIDIAKKEAIELRDKLVGKGVIFDSDKTISNYAQVYASQLNYVNSLIDKYNNMSEEAQESYKDTVDEAKKDFENFIKDLDRYDEVITNLIPDLEKNIQDAIDKQIEIQIEEFNMEIKIRLDLADAEKDWNQFKKKIIDGIKDTDILGNTAARLLDFNTYYKSDRTGILQANTGHVNDILEQLYQIDRGGTSSVYGNNRKQALEDLQTYYKQLMEDLENVADLQEEIHKSYIDMMDEAQDKFDEQIKSYNMITDLIEHDINLISLVYGDEAYSRLSNYYKQQENNYNREIEFQRQQVDFWKQQMDILEKDSDEWVAAKEKWVEAVENWNSSIETAVKNLQDKYLNAINEIFQNLNEHITGGLGLGYVNDQWDLINKNANQYLDTINSLYEVQKLEGKYLDAIDKTDNIAAQRQLKSIMDAELADLKERDRLTQYDIERANKKYEIALKQIALQEAQKSKTTMRLKRDSQGNYSYQYVADADSVGAIQDELADMYNSLYNFDKSRYQDNLNQLYSVWEEFQTKMAEAAQINDPQERAEKELLLQEQYGELINGLVEQNSTIRTNLYDSAFVDLANLYEIDVNNFQAMSDSEKDILMNDLIPYWDAGIQQMADTFAGEGGFLGVCKDAFEELNAATKDYEDGLDELENVANISFEDIANNIDNTIYETQELLQGNQQLINSYETELDAIRAVINELDGLVSKYNGAKDAAIAATTAAYNYWAQEQRLAGKAASGQGAAGSSSSNTNTSSGNTTSGISGTLGGNSAAAAGDGKLVVGDTATFTGQYYYDSYGTSPVGNRYSGIAQGIVVDKINNNPYGIHIHSADGKFMDLGWIKRSQLTGYDTGGYTGAWGDSGRLALLHQKELVLNEKDTGNMLNAIKILRSVTNSIGSSLLSRLSGISANAAISNGESGRGQLEQNVHIDASFPNVTNSREIENAFDNLLNVATQRINRR